MTVSLIFGGIAICTIYILTVIIMTFQLLANTTYQSTRSIIKINKMSNIYSLANEV